MNEHRGAPHKNEKQQKTQEEKNELEAGAIRLFQFLIRKKVQGNVTFPLYDGIVGKAKLELFTDPTQAADIFKLVE